MKRKKSYSISPLEKANTEYRKENQRLRGKVVDLEIKVKDLTELIFELSYDAHKDYEFFWDDFKKQRVLPRLEQVLGDSDGTKQGEIK